MPGSETYTFMVLAGILIGALGWWRLWKSDPRLSVIGFSGMVAAFAGAKVAFLLSEGWRHFDDPNRRWIWASGKSGIGAVPVGWAGVELAKTFTGYSLGIGR